MVDEEYLYMSRSAHASIVHQESTRAYGTSGVYTRAAEVYTDIWYMRSVHKTFVTCGAYTKIWQRRSVPASRRKEKKHMVREDGTQSYGA